ncbi:hypothetical protein BsIDN1_40340 [Bacillus safensis]|uniref:ResB-like domain-containing protein n=1 Tax=Bacillus safensis TaxID=561879 RepID=A0A5S9MFQ0_BACIA|nr:hypothetical protein BsIDN1_40340 [Bacillus safensis]
MRRQRLFSETDKTLDQHTYEGIIRAMKQKSYRVREKNGHILAEKGRFSRWGPYVNHIGLIIFLIGAMLRFVPACTWMKRFGSEKGKLHQFQVRMVNTS